MELCRYGSHFLSSHGLCLKKCSALTPEKNYLITIVVIFMVIIVVIIMVMVMVIFMVTILFIFMPVPMEHKSPSGQTYVGHCYLSMLNTMVAPPGINEMVMAVMIVILLILIT